MCKEKNGMVAIILVNYNGYADTIECVRSILKSTYTNYKIVLVDNGSSDKEKIKNDQFLNANCEVILSPNNEGFSGGNNIGIKYAEKVFEPEYYLLLNNDTVIDMHALEALVNVCVQKDDCGLVTGRILYYEKKNIVWSAGGKFDFKTGIADQPALGTENSEKYEGIHQTSFCTGCVMMIPKLALKKVGYLGEDYFLYAEDTDYCCRVMRKGFQLYYTGDAVVYHKVSASTGKASDLSQYYNVRNNFYIIRKYCTCPFFGYAKRWYRIGRAIIRKELTMKNVIKGHMDFRKGIIGKGEF